MTSIHGCSSLVVIIEIFGGAVFIALAVGKLDIFRVGDVLVRSCKEGDCDYSYCCLICCNFCESVVNKV